MKQLKHKNPGNFRNDLRRASAGGKKGGSMSSGNFKYSRQRAIDAGRKGGLVSKRRKQNEL